jgi:hypothetical protein
MSVVSDTLTSRASTPRPSRLYRQFSAGFCPAVASTVTNTSSGTRHARIVIQDRSDNMRTGRWADFAGDRGGDPVSLVAYLENVPQRRAARLLGQMLSIDVEGRR